MSARAVEKRFIDVGAIAVAFPVSRQQWPDDALWMRGSLKHRRSTRGGRYVIAPLVDERVGFRLLIALDETGRPPGRCAAIGKLEPIEVGQQPRHIGRRQQILNDHMHRGAILQRQGAPCIKARM